MLFSNLFSGHGRRPALASILGFAACAAPAPLLIPRPDPVFGGRTADGWTERFFGRGGSAEERIEAVQALGVLARGGTLSAGGFSDLPAGFPGPSELDPARIARIAAVLGAVAGDVREPKSVRDSAVESLSWMGPGAAPATEALAAILAGNGRELSKKAVWALVRIGPGAAAAAPALAVWLRDPDPQRRILASQGLRGIGADGSEAIEVLAEMLDGEQGEQAADELGRHGAGADAALVRALTEERPTVRRNAARGFWQRPEAAVGAAAVDALLGLLKDDDSEAAENAIWAFHNLKVAPEKVVPALIGKLDSKDVGVLSNLVQALGEYGEKAAAAIPRLVEFAEKGSGEIRSEAAASIYRIGLDETSAQVVGKLRFPPDSSAVGPLFRALLPYPEFALAFLKGNSEGIPSELDWEETLDILRANDPAAAPLRAAIRESDRLSPVVMAVLGGKEFLPRIRGKMEATRPGQKQIWQACARACGDPPDRVVKIGEDGCHDFKPASAWPSTDKKRIGPGSGHGDGWVWLIATGRLVRADGKLAVRPRFLRLNDAFLLGKKEEKEVTDLRYDGDTGRFTAVLQVFGAWAGEGAAEPGPFQTGSALVRIESEGTGPLEIQFYDEMPDVEIRLPAPP